MSKNKGNESPSKEGSTGSKIFDAIGKAICESYKESPWDKCPHDVKSVGDNSYSSRDYDNNHDNVRHGSNE